MTPEQYDKYKFILSKWMPDPSEDKTLDDPNVRLVRYHLKSPLEGVPAYWFRLSEDSFFVGKEIAPEKQWVLHQASPAEKVAKADKIAHAILMERHKQSPEDTYFFDGDGEALYELLGEAEAPQADVPPNLQGEPRVSAEFVFEEETETQTEEEEPFMGLDDLLTEEEKQRLNETPTSQDNLFEEAFDEPNEESGEGSLDPANELKEFLSEVSVDFAHGASQAAAFEVTENLLDALAEKFPDLQKFLDHRVGRNSVRLAFPVVLLGFLRYVDIPQKEYIKVALRTQLRASSYEATREVIRAFKPVFKELYAYYTAKEAGEDVMVDDVGRVVHLLEDRYLEVEQTDAIDFDAIEESLIREVDWSQL